MQRKHAVWPKFSGIKRATFRGILLFLFQPVGGKRQNTGSNRKNMAEPSEPCGCLVMGGGRAAEPGDSFDRCLCSMIQDSGIMLWLVKCLHVDRFAVLLTLPHSTRPYHSPKRAINMPVICCKKKNTLLKYRAFLILSCDKLWWHLRNDWLIDRRSKGTVITNQWIHAMHVAYS